MKNSMRVPSIWLIAGLAVLCAGCATVERPVTPPFKIPIDFQQPGKPVSVKFRVPKRHVFYMALHLTPKLANANTVESWKVLGSYATNQCNEFVDRGIETPIRAQLMKYTTGGELKYFDEEYLPRTSSSGLDYFSREIGATVLDAGEFQLTFVPGRAGAEISLFNAEIHIYSGGWKMVPQFNTVEGRPPLKHERSKECQSL